MTRATVVVAAVVCVLPATGCRHESSSAGFRARAAEICARYSEKDEAIPRSGDELRKSIPLLRAELRELRGVRPPSTAAWTYRRWLAAFDSVVRVLEHEQVVLASDSARLDAAFKRVDKAPVRPLTPEELKHPTEAILSQALEPLPEWHAFVRHSRTIIRQANKAGLRFALLGRRLSLGQCMR